MRHLVVIPGLGSDAAVWSRTVEALGDDASVSVGDTLSDDSLCGMARRILAAAPEHFCLAGVSMGGMVAMEIMRLEPGRVRGLALFDTNARPDTAAQAAYRRQVNTVMLAVPDIRALGAASLHSLVHVSAGEDVRAEIVDMSVRVGAEAYVRQNLAVLARDDLRPILPSISVPTQVIVGDEDLMTPPELSREIHLAIAGSELHVIGMCGHLPPIEKPLVTAERLRALLTLAVGVGKTTP